MAGENSKLQQLVLEVGGGLFESQAAISSLFLTTTAQL
jgi:hypothetical protein